MKTCDSCKAPIIWCTSPAGKPTPLDAEPVKPADHRALYWVLVSEETTSAVTHKLGSPALVAAEERGRPIYLSHFATCPNAARHRKARK